MKQIYDDYVQLKKLDDATFNELAEKLAAEGKKENKEIELTRYLGYPITTGEKVEGKEKVISKLEPYGFSFISEDKDGTLTFAQYAFKAKFYDLLSNNNASFLMGNLSAVKFLTAAKRLAGMYKWEDATKDPVVLKVDSAYLKDDNMITDKSKTGYIEVGKLTI